MQTGYTEVDFDNQQLCRYRFHIDLDDARFMSGDIDDLTASRIFLRDYNLTVTSLQEQPDFYLATCVSDYMTVNDFVHSEEYLISREFKESGYNPEKVYIEIVKEEKE